MFAHQTVHCIDIASIRALLMHECFQSECFLLSPSWIHLWLQINRLDALHTDLLKLHRENTVAECTRKELEVQVTSQVGQASFDERCLLVYCTLRLNVLSFGHSDGMDRNGF